MEFEQIVKRLDWLDEEHRNDKSTIDALVQRASNLEGDLKVANKKIKELTTQISHLSSTPARIEQFDNALALQRTEIVKYIDDLDNKRQEQQPKVDKRYQIQFEGVQKSISDLRKIKEPIAEIKRELKAHADEEARRSKLSAEWELRMQTMVKIVEDIQRTQKATEEPRRQDSKRLADLQGELGAARKRLDESREKIDLFTDSIRRIETRLNEIMTNEAERRQAQINFIETQARLQVERERTWKEWEIVVNNLHKQSEVLDRNLQDWEITQRTVKHTQEKYDEMVQKFERRINEITEIQRLVEDRFRQEWVTFKADDQKRWASFTLSQDETHKESRGDVAKIEERLTSLEDLTQTQQDVLQQTKDANEQLFQGMVAQIHELLSAYERIMSTK
jgi:chromosome segregation ATPase